MLNVAKKRLKDSERAEDAVQNCFYRIHSWRHKYNPKFQVSQWFFVILRSEINKLFDGPHPLSFDEKPIHILTLSQNSMDESIDFKRQLDSLEEDLSDEDMNLLKMRYVDGLAFEEISEELGLNSTTLRQKLSRLVRRLRKGRI